MEETPFLPLPEEDDEDDEPTTDRKKRLLPSIAALLKTPTKDKEEASQNIATTLLGRQAEVNADEEADDTASVSTVETDKNIPRTDGEELQLSEEETAYINQRIAQEHLEHPVTSGYPQEPVINFLELVEERVETDTAFKSTIINHGLESSTEPLSEEVNKLQNQTVSETSSQPILVKPLRPAQPEVSRQDKKVMVEQKSTQTPSSAAELAKIVIGSPSKARNKTEAIEHKQARVAAKVEQMEASMTRQENTLQRLSLEKSAPLRSTALKERTQPGRQESHLGLKKPERAGHIGKVVVNQEKARSKYSPETSMKQAKTMRRAELLEVSEKIKVEGASLRHMFDNNLFSEGALRRLVGAYLEGREIQPLLRHEILERQIDYERDPLLRDKINRDESNEALFDKILQASPEPVNLNLSEQKNKRTKLPRPHDTPQTKLDNQTKYPLSNIILGTTIAALIGIIIYLLVR